MDGQDHLLKAFCHPLGTDARPVQVQGAEAFPHAAFAETYAARRVDIN